MWATLLGVFILIGLCLGMPTYFRWERRMQSDKLHREIEKYSGRHPAGRGR